MKRRGFDGNWSRETKVKMYSWSAIIKNEYYLKIIGKVERIFKNFVYLWQ